MRFHSLPIAEHEEVPLADEGRLEAAVEHWKAREIGARAPSRARNACYVLCVQRPESDDSANARLQEMTSLVETQGDRIVGARSHLLQRPDPRTLIGKGVAERVGCEARERGADLLVVDAELSPSQARNLEDATGLAVCDREAVILNVFERHATTRRARIQVEIAHLEYLRPRIRGIGLNMDQQAGGILGGRGPGETASELLARRLDGRLADLRRKLAQLERSDSAQRRQRRGCARVVLIGYTNAGKTSLMNALTCAGLSARDRLFETLDTTSRSLSRHGGDVLLSDTVGFIRRLPERLFASFASTLAELSEASLLLLVTDASSPEIEEHLCTTQSVLERLGAERIPRLVVFNKSDLLPQPIDSERCAALCDGHPYLALSSRDPAAVAELRQTILTRARAHQRPRQIFVPYELQPVTRDIYARCRVLATHAAPTGTQFVVEGEPRILAEIARAVRRRRP
jgi:GTP-binding protein HflX